MKKSSIFSQSCEMKGKAFLNKYLVQFIFIRQVEKAKLSEWLELCLHVYYVPYMRLIWFHRN